MGYTSARHSEGLFLRTACRRAAARPACSVRTAKGRAAYAALPFGRGTLSAGKAQRLLVDARLDRSSTRLVSEPTDVALLR